MKNPLAPSKTLPNLIKSGKYGPVGSDGKN